MDRFWGGLNRDIQEILIMKRVILWTVCFVLLAKLNRK